MKYSIERTYLSLTFGTELGETRLVRLQIMTERLLKRHHNFVILAQSYLHDWILLKLREYIDNRVVFYVVRVSSCGGHWGIY
jgi:hypothetical protein